MRLRVPFSDWTAEDDLSHLLRPALLHPHFSRETELAFERWRLEGRLLLYRYSLLLSILIYDIFLIPDYLYYPKDFYFCVVVRLLINTPLAFLLLYLVPRLPVHGREWAIASTHLVPGISLLYMSHGSAEWMVESQGALIILQMFTSHALRPIFRYFCATTGVLLVADVCFMALHPGLSDADRGMNIALFLVAVVLSLLADYTMERKDRIHFLLRQHNEEQNAQLSAMNQELARISLIDTLTGIANRRAFNAAYRTAWEAAITQQEPIAILMMDLDHFKMLNDQHGHAYGDVALKAVATTIRDTLRSDSDIAARYGGEEFVAMLHGRTVTEALPIAERLCAAIRHLHLPLADNGAQCRVTISVGVASLRPSAYMLATDLLRFADEALYAAKSGGRDRVMAWAPGKE